MGKKITNNEGLQSFFDLVHGGDKNMLIAHITPVISLVAGILILLIPRLLNYIVAIYLIIAGVIGLGIF